MMKRVLILFFLVSCASPNSNYDLNKTKLNFDKYLSLKEFQELLIKYAKKNPYPNIDE